MNKPLCRIALFHNVHPIESLKFQTSLMVDFLYYFCLQSQQFYHNNHIFLFYIVLSPYSITHQNLDAFLIQFSHNRYNNTRHHSHLFQETNLCLLNTNDVPKVMHNHNTHNAYDFLSFDFQILHFLARKDFSNKVFPLVLQNIPFHILFSPDSSIFSFLNGCISIIIIFIHQFTHIININ